MSSSLAFLDAILRSKIDEAYDASSCLNPLFITVKFKSWRDCQLCIFGSSGLSGECTVVFTTLLREVLGVQKEMARVHGGR